MATILGFRVSTYARGIMWGTNRLTKRDGYDGVVDGYYEPVENYIAQHYSVSKIEDAFTNGWLNQQEHDEIIVLTGTVEKLSIIE